MWLPLARDPDAASIRDALVSFRQHAGKDITVFGTGPLARWLRAQDTIEGVGLVPQVYPPVLDLQVPARADCALPAHLRRLESESIHILREAVAEASNPVMLYSIGKDSGVMLHLARKAFHPSPLPFPLLHVDTRWKFQEMYLFRQHVASQPGVDLRVHINPAAIERDINPFDHGSAMHTDITKTEGLKQALDQQGYDVIFGGARRDEEKSRAKERIFSFRTATHRWDPKRQRPELWHLYNARTGPGESTRVFPLSNWTEIDIWEYIHHQGLPVVPLYLAKPRAVVMRDDMILMVDDDRCRLLPGEEIQIRKVRFRTLGCYPLSGAIESEAATVGDILAELQQARQSERQGRRIDTDSAGSMEKKKQEGYF
nr:sulfate adenylyltransferase subunit CysD [Caenimonas sedimenti]